MNSQAAGAIGAICMLLLWSFVIWPAIKRALSSATNLAGNKIEDALRPSADSAQLLVVALPKAQAIFARHLASVSADWEQVDTGVRKIIEAQMIVVSFSTTLLNIALQDAAYDLGMVDRIKLLEGRNGFPKIKISDDAFRAALKTLWASFSPATRMNLDMRYRYIFVQKLNSDAEAHMYEKFNSYAVQTITNEMAHQANPDLRWLDLVRALSTDDRSGAIEALNRL